MRRHLTNHLGMALGVFVTLTGAFLLATGTLRFGAPVALTDHGLADARAHDYDKDHADQEAQAKASASAEGAADLAALEKKTCEHNIRTLDCDECRFELGVVKVEPQVAKALLGTAKVEERPVGQTIRLTGKVEQDPTRVVDVTALGAGKVMKVYKFLGDKVQRGDLLAVVRSGEFGEAKAAYIEAQARFQLAKRTLERERDLFQKQVSSEADYLDATKEYQAAEAALAAADKRLHVFGLDDGQIAEINSSEDNGGFADLHLRAPRAGAIVAHSISEGKVVEPAQDLYTIADLSNLWVWGDLYEQDLAALHEALKSGQPMQAKVCVAAYPQEEFTAKVDLLGNQLDEHTRTIKVRLQMPNTDGKLKPGMFATVESRLAPGAMALFVPKEAVLSDEGKSFVFQRYKDDLWVRRDVTVGRNQDQYVEIVRGLPAGVVVAGKGGFMLKSDVLRGKMGAGCAD